MIILTIKKNEDGSEIYEVNDKIVEMFKDQPSDLRVLIDSLKQKEVKLSQEETNRKKEETLQKQSESKKESIKNVCNAINLVTQTIVDAYSHNSSELNDLRSDKEVLDDISKNYKFSD